MGPSPTTLAPPPAIALDPRRVAHAPTPRRSDSARLRRGVPVVSLATAALLLPGAVWVARTFAFGDSYRFVSDQAVIEMMTRDVGRHAVLLGPYSRFGWNHPGPLLYYLLAVPYRVAGTDAAALGLGAWLLNAGALAGIAFVVRRRAGAASALFALASLGTMLHSMGPTFVADPWNPHVAVLPFALLVVLAWDAACGGRRSLPWAAAVGSFCVQSHAGYAPVVLALGAGAIVGLAATHRARRGCRTRRDMPGPRLAALRRTGLTTITVGALAWTPPVVEQLAPGHGNLTRLGQFAASSDSRLGFGDALHAVFMHFGSRPDWLFGARRTVITLGTVDLRGRPTTPWLLLALVAVTFAAVRRRDTDVARLGGTLLVGIGAAVAAVAGISGDLYPYLILYLLPLGALSFATVLWAAWRWHGARLTTDRVARRALSGVVAALTLLMLARSATASNPQDGAALTLDQLGDELAGALPPHTPVLLRSSPNFVALWYEAGLAVELERRGIEVRVEPSAAAVFGTWRADPAGGDSRVTLFVAADDDITMHEGEPGWRVVARADPLDAPSRERAVKARRDAGRYLSAGDQLPAVVVESFLATATSPEIAVFALDGPPPR